MTDRVTAFLVVLDRDIPGDSQEAQATQAALNQIRFVASVEPVITEHPLDVHAAVTRRDTTWRQRISDLLSREPGQIVEGP